MSQDDDSIEYQDTDEVLESSHAARDSLEGEVSWDTSWVEGWGFPILLPALLNILRA
jgi:hypothetical protein